jgi:hypothetical protein
MNVKIKREYFPTETLGSLKVFDKMLIVFECKTIELPDKYNQRKISCIPEGTYQVSKIVSPTKGKCFSIHDVPNRSAVLIHIGNYAAGKKVDTEGCILPGMGFQDLNSDGNPDVSGSTVAMEHLLKILPDTFELCIC